MPEYEISTIPVNFPFEPYDLQRAYMEKVIKCLQNGTNGILESPTGTGKTLSLLCSTLAYIRSRKKAQKQEQQSRKAESQISETSEDSDTEANENIKIPATVVPKIIYASRTHSQLTQAMRELKRTAYSYMRGVVLGSREQLCIHPDVMCEKDNAAKLQLCKARVDSRSCSYHARVETHKDHVDFCGPSIMDIEDLVTVGRKLKMCPYYAGKELVRDADIIFLPYNYLLDPKAISANAVELANAIIILDEAHNIEKVCEESASTKIRSTDITTCIEDITAVIKIVSEGAVKHASNDEQKELKMDDLLWINENLIQLDKAIEAIEVANHPEGVTLPVSFIYELLNKTDFNYKTSKRLLNLCDKLVQFMMAESAYRPTLRKGGSFLVLHDFAQIVFINKEDMIQKIYRSFKVHVEIEAVNNNSKNKITPKMSGWISKPTIYSNNTTAIKVINFWCFNPGFGMQQLLNKRTRSIILTSGTLAPLKPLIAELDIPIAQQLENPHIIDESQVYVRIVSTGPDRETLLSNYTNRDNPKYINSLGRTIFNVARIVPDGLLVFFPSYPLLNQCANFWQANGLWADISQHKPIFVEPRGKDAFTATMADFYKSIKDSKGACFLAVCRGKVSEGLDFADRNGRTVIISGLPFPPLKDPKIILKKRYLEDNRTKENQLLSGQEWYALEATRAVNQAIGRVIRHRNDYGAILLCDMRFQDTRQIQQLSKWVRKHVNQNAVNSTNFGVVVRELSDFFKNAIATMPLPEKRIVDTIVESTKRGDDQLEHIVRSKYFCSDEDAPKRKDPIAISQTRGRSSPRLNAIKTIDLTKSNDAVPPIDRSKARKRCKLEDYVNYDKPTAQLSPLTVPAETIKWGSTQLQTLATIKKEAPTDRTEFLRELRITLTAEQFNTFTKSLFDYKDNRDFDVFITTLKTVLGTPNLMHMLCGMRKFIMIEHKQKFDVVIRNLRRQD